MERNRALTGELEVLYEDHHIRHMALESAQIRFEPTACSYATPTLEMTPTESQWLEPGAAASYTVSVASNDSSACLASEIDLSASLTAGHVRDMTSRLQPQEAAEYAKARV